MGQMELVILNETGSNRQKAELPDDKPVSRLVSALVQKMNLPTTGPNGPVAYKLDHKASGKRLGDNDTLAGAGVKAGDELRMVTERVAG